ncbi:hypothetical protein OH77DRAFT_1514358 [Trametes cingulata]|nr:hypothetical protein OH77DRAFT_1514358 [Trametes cingulata]
MPRRSRRLQTKRPLSADNIRARHVWTVDSLAPCPLLFTPDHSAMVACNFEGDVIFLEKQHWMEIGRAMHRTMVIAMCWATLCEQPVLVCLCADGDVRLWPLDNRFVVQTTSRAVIVHNGFSAITEGTLAFEEERQILAVAGCGHVRVWSLEGLQATLLAALRSDLPVVHLRFVDLETGKRLLLFYRTGGKMVQFDVVERKVVSEVLLSRNMENRDTAVISSASCIILRIGDHELQVYDIAVIRQLRRRGDARVQAQYTSPLSDHEECGQALGLYRDYIVTSTVSGQIQLWDMASGLSYGTFRSNGNRIKAILDMSSRDICYMAIGSSAGVEVWEVHAGDAGSSPCEVQVPLRRVLESNEGIRDRERSERDAYSGDDEGAESVSTASASLEQADICHADLAAEGSPSIPEDINESKGPCTDDALRAVAGTAIVIPTIDLASASLGTRRSLPPTAAHRPSRNSTWKQLLAEVLARMLNLLIASVVLAMLPRRYE